MMRFATQGLVDPNRYPPGGGVIDEIPRRWDEESGTMVPINPPGGILENQSSNNDFINTRDRIDDFLTSSGQQINLFNIPLGDYIEPGNLRRKLENDRYQNEQGPFRRPMLNVAGTYGQPSNMPDYVYESLRRQMGPGYGFGDYKTEDMKNVINWNAGRLRV